MITVKNLERIIGQLRDEQRNVLGSLSDNDRTDGIIKGMSRAIDLLNEEIRRDERRVKR